MQWNKVVFFVPDVQRKVHEVLGGGGDVLAAQTRHILPHIAPEDVVEWSSVLCIVIDVLLNIHRY